MDAFFDDFAMIVALPFRDLFFMNFSSFPNRFLNRANHEIIKNTSVLLGYSTVGNFRTRTRVMKIAMQISHNCRIEFSINLMIFRHKLPQRCFLQFVMEDCPQNGRFCSAWGSKNRYFLQPGPNIYFFIYFGHPWIPFGSLLNPFGSLVATFRCLSASFWRFLAHFCFPWGSGF